MLKFKRNLTNKPGAVTFNGKELYFHTQNRREKNRIKSFARKEPGTLEWISGFKQGEVFYDIGANIGIYSLPAASMVGKSGRVYAFEPHIFSFNKLVKNIVLNDFGCTIEACSTPISENVETAHFNYTTLESGSTGSQLGHTNTYDDDQFTPVFKELKLGVSIDILIDNYNWQIPDHIKIDVDGNEAKIIKGMKNLLSGKFVKKPNSIQIEVNPSEHASTIELMNNANYVQASHHFTATGQRLIDEGHDPTKYPYNIIFKPK